MISQWILCVFFGKKNTFWCVDVLLWNTSGLVSKNKVSDRIGQLAMLMIPLVPLKKAITSRYISHIAKCHGHVTLLKDWVVWQAQSYFKIVAGHDYNSSTHVSEIVKCLFLIHSGPFLQESGLSLKRGLKHHDHHLWRMPKIRDFENTRALIQRKRLSPGGVSLAWAKFFLIPHVYHSFVPKYNSWKVDPVGTQFWHIAVCI